MNSCIRWISTLVLLTVCAACSGKNEDGQSTTAELDQASTSASSEAKRSDPSTLEAKHLGALVDLVVAEAADLPHAEFEPAALAKQLGKNPRAHFEWVRDQTWWAPYRGLLRGSKGVMLDRVGSSLDRAVLLGELLRHSGHTVRLAHSQLSEDVARELLSKIRPIPDQRRGPRVAITTNEKRQRSAEAIIPGLAMIVQRQAAESKRRSDVGTALVRSQTEELYAAVKDAALLDNSAANQAMIAALRDHWWVEREDNGKWIAMDVLKADAKPGDTLTGASQTSTWDASSDVPSIPETEWHSVQVRLVVERYLAGATSESTLLETVLRPAEVFDRQISLVHFPKPWPDQLEDSTTNPNALREAAFKVRQWTPILRVGDEFIVQSGFAENGDIKKSPFDPLADLHGGLMGGMDSALGGGEEYEPYASAEWIDYEIRVPGQPNQRVRRQLFDLLGPARRLARDPNFIGNAENRRLERAEALLSRTDILLQPCEFTNEFIAHLAMTGIVAQQQAIKKLSLERDVEKKRSQASDILDEMEVWGPLLGFAAWRSALGNQDADWFIGRPNVINLREGQRLAAGEQPIRWQLIDVAANATDVRRGAAGSPFEARLERGVADTVAEVLTISGNTSVAENTAAIFDRAGAGQGRRAFIAPRDTAAIGKLAWPEDETARIAEDINAGFMVVALRQPVELRGIQRVGWWRVHPATGETVGVMDTGFHQQMIEDAETRRAREIAEEVRAYWAPKPQPAHATWPTNVMIGGMGILVACMVYDAIVWGGGTCSY